MPRKVVFRAHAGFAGTDTAEGFIYPDGTTDEQLHNEAWQFGLNHAESYGVYWSPNMDILGDDEDEDGCEDDGDQYSDQIEGWWEEYDPEKHDGIITYGCSSEPSFTDYTQ